MLMTGRWQRLACLPRLVVGCLLLSWQNRKLLLLLLQRHAKTRS
jgi:hypothetical protein